MWLVVFAGVIVAVTVGLLLWSRRNRVAGDPKQDPLANGDIGEIPHSQSPSTGGWPGS